MHKDTEKVLERIMEQSRISGGFIEQLQVGNDADHIDWLLGENYLRSSHEPVRAFEGTMYMSIMPTEKAYEWERERRETVSGRARVIEAKLERELAATKSMRETVEKLKDEAQRVGKSWCGSSLGNHAKIYYQELKPVPAQAYWDIEWGMKQDYLSLSKTQGAWQTYTIDEIKDKIYSRCGITETEMSDYGARLLRTFEQAEAELMGILEQSEGEMAEATRQRLLNGTETQRSNLTTAEDEARRMALAHTPTTSGDTENIARGPVPAAHHHILAGVLATQRLEWGIEQLWKIANGITQATRPKKTKREKKKMRGSKVFIGHDGESHAWRQVKDHLENQGFKVDEFERTGVAGKQVKDRLEEMMDDADWAVLVITVRDTSNPIPSRNVIHEIGYAQGCLGWEKAIILRQKGCELPTNLNGTVYLEFEGQHIKSVFADLDKVLRGEEHH